MKLPAYISIRLLVIQEPSLKYSVGPCNFCIGEFQMDTSKENGRHDSSLFGLPTSVMDERLH